MYKPKLEKEFKCPLEYPNHMCTCNKGSLRHSALRDEMVNITDAILTPNLKELIADGIVIR